MSVKAALVAVIAIEVAIGAAVTATAEPKPSPFSVLSRDGSVVTTGTVNDGIQQGLSAVPVMPTR